LKFIRLVFSSIENGTITIGGFDPDWAKPTYRLFRIFVVAFAVVVAFPYIPGSNTQAFKGVSLFIGLVFSLGSTSIIGNMISGYTLTYRRVFKPGDRVKIGDHVGDVQESRLLVTYLRTIKNEVTAVPNSSIVNAAVVNYSSLAQTKGLILHTSVGIGYETPWRQVEAILFEAAARTPGLLREPKPFVHEKELRTFDVEYQLNVYCDRPNSTASVYAALHRNILDLCNEYGVQIMTPAYESDPKDAKVVAKRPVVRGASCARVQWNIRAQTDFGASMHCSGCPTPI
jgi:small-conductance mechanosensitive channel